MIQIRLQLAFACIVGLAGCAGTTGQQHVENGQAALSASTKVLQSIQQMPFPTIKFGELQTIELGSNGNVLQENGKRYFAQGFRLPQEKRPLSIRFGSYRIGTAQDPAIFYPEVRVLDSKFNLVRTLAAEDFVYRTNQDGSGLFTTFFLNAESVDQAYILLTGREPEDAALKISQDNLTTSTVVSAPIGARIFFWYMPTGISTKPAKIRALPMGKVEVFMEQYKPMTIGAK